MRGALSYVVGQVLRLLLEQSPVHLDRVLTRIVGIRRWHRKDLAQQRPLPRAWRLLRPCEDRQILLLELDKAACAHQAEEMHGVLAEGGASLRRFALAELVEGADLHRRIVPFGVHVGERADPLPVPRVRELHAEDHHESYHHGRNLVRVRMAQVRAEYFGSAAVVSVWLNEYENGH